MTDPTDELRLYEADAVVLQAVTATLRHEAARLRNNAAQYAVEQRDPYAGSMWEIAADSLDHQALNLETTAAAFWRGFAFAEAAR